MNYEEIEKELRRNDSTLLSFPQRGPWGDKSYRGNCSGWIQAFLIWKYQPKRFAELFAGSGTGYDVCQDFIKCGYLKSYVGADLNPTPVRPGILNVNAVTDEVPDSFRSAELTFMHPPYGAEIGIPYAGAEWGAEKKWNKINGKNVCTTIDHTKDLIPQLGYDPKDYDLGRMEWSKFIDTLNKIVMKYYAAMPKGGRMAILMGDVRRNGKCMSMLKDIVQPGQLEQIIIKAQHNCVSDGRTYAHKNFVPIVHEYIMVIQKVVDYIVSFSLPTKKEVDIRDSITATWKDVICAVMRHLGGRASLSSLYNEIKGYKKCEKNSHVEEKIRQVVRAYPSLFNPLGNGEYCLVA